MSLTDDMLKRNYLKYILILGFAVLLFSLHLYGPIGKNIQSGFFGFTKGVSSLLYSVSMHLKNNIDFVFHIDDLKSQNEELTQKIIGLQIDRNKINELEIENKLLKQELGFLSESEKGTLIPARIISRDPMTFSDYIAIDKGARDGLAEGMPVLANGILIGQLVQVFEDAAKVNLITSKDSIIQAMLQDSRAKGILKGGISGLYIDNIVSDTEFKNGEYVVTSGLGGNFKQGILIGRTSKVQSYSSGIFKSISVEPLVDFSSLELVFIQK